MDTRIIKTKIWVALLLVYIIWGSTYLAIHYAVATLPPFLMTGTCFLVSGFLLYVWRRLAGDQAPTPRQWLAAVVIGLLLLVGGSGSISLAEQKVASGIAALLIGSVPLWMTAIEALQPGGMHPNWLGVLGLLIGFGGIFLLVAPSLTGRANVEINLLGISLLIVAALSWSIGSIYNRHADLPASSLLSTGMEMLAGGMGLYLTGTLKGEWVTLVLSRVTLSSWLGLIYLIVLGTLVAFTAYAWLLRNARCRLFLLMPMSIPWWRFYWAASLRENL